MFYRLIVFLITTTCIFSSSMCVADDSNDFNSIRIAIKPIEPFVDFNDDGTASGLSIDVIKAIGERLDQEINLIKKESVTEVLQSVSTGDCDAAIAAITINADREKIVDFTHGYFRSGLRIALPLSRTSSSILGLLGRLISPDIFMLLGLLILLTFVTASLLWLVERGVNPKEFPNNFFPGVGEAIWWCISAVISGGCENKAPVTLLGRCFAVVWMLGGIVLLATFTATLASQMTIAEVGQDISTKDDLRGRTVGTLEGTAVVNVLKEYGANIEEFKDIESLLGRDAASRCDAIVFDAPILKYYINKIGGQQFYLVGDLFEYQDYGIALTRGNKLLDRINIILLELREAGVLEKINATYLENNP